jgi:5'-methylthioinosine phosphorylase
VAAVGGIRTDMTPARLVIPDQIIDYTWGRISTFYEDAGDEVVHIDFSQPYCETLRQRLLVAAVAAAIDVVNGGTYGATQGPRLETAAEISRMERDGCHLVGMTAMPEAALARELGLCYASCAVVANWAAGKGEGGVISMDEIEANLKIGMASLSGLLQALCG